MKCAVEEEEEEEEDTGMGLVPGTIEAQGAGDVTMVANMYDMTGGQRTKYGSTKKRRKTLQEHH